MSVKTQLYKYWIKLSGSSEQFPLHARIFHSVCLISILGLAYNVPFNYMVGLGAVAVASAIVLGLTATLYYQSRFRGNTKNSIFLVNFVGIGLFTINYFLNSGINGPTALFFLLFLLITIAINPVEQNRVWIPINVIVVIGLYTFEYFYPEYIPDTYNDRLTKFVDEISAYVVIAILAFFCADYIRRAYENEKQLTIDKSRSIEDKNLQIIMQNKELERLNAQKNKLMSIVAHDLRSPLANIQNYLELLSGFDLDESQRVEIKKDLLSSTKETLSMLTKLLAWSKSQAHGLVVSSENMQLGELLEGTLLLERAAAAQKGIKLEYHFPSDHAIYADREMMQLVVRNFVGNAIKFTPADGKVMVSSVRRGDDCIITIQDTGIGISPQRQDELFSLNAKSTFGTGGEKGVGLGLLLCHEYVTAQNGSIWFESIQGNGTCFYISMPFSSKIPDSVGLAVTSA
ncbi:sensor histidine kinase [Dyadobacter luteus]|uniref:histidine kinase n=1 Tax=Dyadobacter luteus TaxID=2259619 RepID=A0A3D8Y340_9BACT|nr:HAMP domain-containing sensor histidine kinase [Dyadobacter luteus]REA55965.1 sensor histidine kinase [Dyadobacter luteus]